MTHYSRRLGDIAPAQFQAALDCFDLGRFLHAEPITAGNFGQNLYLTSTTGEYVLRGAPFWPEQFPRERYFTDRLHQGTSAPVPWPYRVDPKDDIFGWSYVIMPRMPGLQLSDPAVQDALTPDDRRGIAQAMGETIAELHRLAWPHAGRYDLETDAIRPFDVSYDEHVVARIREFVREATSLSDRTAPADVAWVEEVIAANRTALAVPFQPCFVHGDYKEGNLVVRHSGGGWQVSGVFDYMDACTGDGEHDLPRSVASFADEDPALARTFLDAYARCRPPRPGLAGRFAVYMLYDRTILWQFGQRHGVWWDPTFTLREWAEPYVALALLQ
jgi:aminoglycoside phosphotransferase (APT) family kinase protein